MNKNAKEFIPRSAQFAPTIPPWVAGRQNPWAPPALVAPPVAPPVAPTILPAAPAALPAAPPPADERRKKKKKRKGRNNVAAAAPAEVEALASALVDVPEPEPEPKPKPAPTATATAEALEEAREEARRAFDWCIDEIVDSYVNNGDGLVSGAVAEKTVSAMGIYHTVVGAYPYDYRIAACAPAFELYLSPSGVLLPEILEDVRRIVTLAIKEGDRFPWAKYRDALVRSGRDWHDWYDRGDNVNGRRPPGDEGSVAADKGRCYEDSHVFGHGGYGCMRRPQKGRLGSCSLVALEDV